MEQSSDFVNKRMDNHAEVIELTLSVVAVLVGVVDHSLARSRVLWFLKTDEETREWIKSVGEERKGYESEPRYRNSRSEHLP